MAKPQFRDKLTAQSAAPPAVIPLSLSDRELLDLKQIGVVGLRLNVLFGGGIGFREMESYGGLCREMGWHLQLLVDAHELSDIKVSVVTDFETLSDAN